MRYDITSIITSSGNSAFGTPFGTKKLKYFIKSGEYWKYQHLFDKNKLKEIDQLWLNCIK